MEVWKDIEEFKGLYQVSSYGRVKSLERLRYKSKAIIKEKIRKVGSNGNGYYIVRLSKNRGNYSRKIHQLVALEFLGHTPCGMSLVINHIDLNKLNNRADNLEIVTQRENASLKHIKWTSKYTGVCWSKANNKWRAAIGVNGKTKYIGYFDCELEASEAYQKELKLITN